MSDSPRQPYAQFIRDLPQADLPLPGVRANLLSAAQGQVVFFELPAGAEVPTHQHGAQWGIVVDGQIELTIGGQTRVFQQGQAYFIAEGEPHSARVLVDSRAIDVFADPDRYQAK